MTRGIKALVKKKEETHVSNRQLGSSESLKECRGCKNEFEFV